MNIDLVNTAKKKISLILILLLAAVSCSSFNVSCDIFHSGGSITGSGNTAISQSLIALSPAAVKEDRSGSSSHEQNFQKTSAASDILSRLTRKLLHISGASLITEHAIRFDHYFTSLCIIDCAFLLLIHVRFIHLKDGSK